MHNSKKDDIDQDVKLNIADGQSYQYTIQSKSGPFHAYDPVPISQEAANSTSAWHEPVLQITGENTIPTPAVDAPPSTLPNSIPPATISGNESSNPTINLQQNPSANFSPTSWSPNFWSQSWFPEAYSGALVTETDSKKSPLKEPEKPTVNSSVPDKTLQSTGIAGYSGVPGAFFETSNNLTPPPVLGVTGIMQPVPQSTWTEWDSNVSEVKSDSIATKNEADYIREVAFFKKRLEQAKQNQEQDLTKSPLKSEENPFPAGPSGFFDEAERIHKTAIAEQIKKQIEGDYGSGSDKTTIHTIKVIPPGTEKPTVTNQISSFPPEVKSTETVILDISTASLSALHDAMHRIEDALNKRADDAAESEAIYRKNENAKRESFLKKIIPDLDKELDLKFKEKEMEIEKAPSRSLKEAAIKQATKRENELQAFRQRQRELQRDKKINELADLVINDLHTASNPPNSTLKEPVFQTYYYPGLILGPEGTGLSIPPLDESVQEYPTSIIKTGELPPNGFTILKNEKKAEINQDLDYLEEKKSGTFSRDLSKAGYRIAGTQTVNAIQHLVLASLSPNKALEFKETINSKISSSFISLLLGWIMTTVNQDPSNIRFNSLAKELRIKGISTFGDWAVEELTDVIFQAATEAIQTLPVHQEYNEQQPKEELSVEIDNELVDEDIFTQSTKVNYND